MIFFRVHCHDEEKPPMPPSPPPPNYDECMKKEDLRSESPPAFDEVTMNEKLSNC